LILRSVAPSLLERQLLFFVLGGVTFWLTSRISFRQWQTISWPLYGALIGALVLTQLIATVTRGTKSWIEIGPFHAQSSQLAVAIAALVAGTLIKEKKLTLKEFILLVGVLAFPALLIFLEPDLGTAVIYLLALTPVVFFNRIPKLFLFSSAVVVIGLIVVSWLFILKPYQKDRITSFLSQEKETQDASYNAIQSVIAVGSGRVTGRGLGQGTQSQLRFLPERQTDFVFASFAEETGFIGGVVLVSLYGSLVMVCLLTAYHVKSESAQLYALITAVMFLAQIGVNIGMNIGLVPITGITLPFVSYGGSSILALSFHLGCLQSILNDLRPQAKLIIR
jgi:rod shape determining protein RodA